MLVVSAASSMLFANVDLRTNIQDIYYRGTCEEAGAITMSVNGDDFRTASTSTPVFIRVRLNKGATLCNTLVSPFVLNSNGTDRSINVPVYLAMRVESSNTSAFVTAANETVSIVRWVAGETDLWLRVQTSSQNWINVGGTPQAPSNEFSVAWSFGSTARASKGQNYSLYTERGAIPGGIAAKANLPANTRNPWMFAGLAGTEADAENYAQSTLLCVDVSDATFLTAFPADGSDLDFDTISFDFPRDNDGYQDGDVLSAPTADDILMSGSQQLNTNFSGDDTIARGFDLNCHISIGKVSQTDLAVPLQARTFTWVDLCISTGLAVNADQSLDELVLTKHTWLTNLTFRVRDCFGWRTGSYTHLSIDDGAEYGFPVDTDSQTGDIIYGDIIGGSFVEDDNGDFVRISAGAYGMAVDGASVTSFAIARRGATQTLQSVDGNLNRSVVASEMFVFFTGTGFEGEPNITVGASVCIDPRSNPTTIEFDGIVVATNRDSELDTAPYDGIGDSSFDVAQPVDVNGATSRSYNISPYDQRAFCPPNTGILIGTYHWNYGGFFECSESVSIFYPYLPKVKDTVFWAGISFVNQGYCDFESVSAIHYEADGSRWAATFPGLAVRNQQTWLLEDKDGAATYTNDEGHADVALTTTGTDLEALNMRSSMFLVGSTDGCVGGVTTRSSQGSDLDGFALIGNSQTNVVYGYLPRNTDQAAEGFEQDDMPPRNSKRGEFDLSSYQELVDMMSGLVKEDAVVSPFRK